MTPIDKKVTALPAPEVASTEKMGVQAAIRTVELPLNKGQHLSGVLAQIPTNTILDKTITGCGATTLELNAARHSIIIVPNLPVIKGKIRRHKFLLGVFEGVKVEDIEQHLYDYSDQGYLKIMTTPESFRRVKVAIANVGMNIYTQFFILFDECERAIQDVSFRQNIILPMEDFFKSDNKAMVSATPLTFLDPRFVTQGFQLLKIRPTYDYRIRLDLYATNNVLQTLFRVIRKAQATERTVCIFYNSVRGIAEVIEMFRIADQSNIYCGDDRRVKLKRLKVKNAYSQIDEPNGLAQLNKVNFFTSRFYSAVDIELDYKPVVVVVTELYAAPSSIIDPQTEAVQAFGRFRKGIESCLVITNTNAQIECKSQQACLAYLEEQHTAYKEVYDLHQSHKERGATDCLGQMLQSSNYAKFAMPNGEPNYFMYNNALRHEYLKSLYRHRGGVKYAYRSSQAFKIEYHTPDEKSTDFDRKQVRSKSAIQQEINKVAFDQIANLMNSRDEYEHIYLANLTQSYSLMAEAYELLGADEVKKLQYDTVAIQAAVVTKQALKQRLEVGVIGAIYNAFKEYTRYDSKQINIEVERIFNKFNIAVRDKRGLANELKTYFEMTANNRGKSRGYQLGAKLHSVGQGLF